MVGSCPLGWGAEEEDFEDFGLEQILGAHSPSSAEQVAG